MKRSEMIEIIYNCLKDNHFGQYGEFKKMANDILCRIEDNGMLPPPIYGEQYSECPENNWEKEDVN